MKFFSLVLLFLSLVSCQSQPEVVETAAEPTETPTAEIKSGTDPDADEDSVAAVVFDEKDPNVASILQDLQAEINVDPETVASFEKESAGRYLETEKKFARCKAFPLSFIWKEFSPFFDYRWDKEFENFAALFLAIWERETAFAMPSKGVTVATHCSYKKMKRKAVVVPTLGGKQIYKDLEKAKSRESWLKRSFPRCNFNSADFGPMQWNNKYRLTQTPYRKQIETALLLSSGYKPIQVRKLSKSNLAKLVKFNSQALFILGGLSLKEGAKKPLTTIRDYNTSPIYRKAVIARRLAILKLLREDASCSPDQILGAKNYRSE